MVRLVVELGDVFGGRLLVAGKGDRWIHDHFREPGFSVVALFEIAGRVVFVAVDDVPAHGSDREEGEHVAAGERGGECLLGIGAVGVAQVGRCGGGAETLSAAGKLPGVLAGEFFVAESAFTTLPCQGRVMLAHVNGSGETAGESMPILSKMKRRLSGAVTPHSRLPAFFGGA